MATVHHQYCPDKSALQDYLDEALPASQAADIDGHISSCNRCQQVADDMVDHRAAKLFKTSDYQSKELPPHEAQDNLPAVPEQPPRIDGYEVIEELGQGSYGTVVQAFDKTLSRLVAIKIPHPHVVQAVGGVEDYLHEARTVASLEHPHIVRIYEAKMQSAEQCYLVSQYVDGETLEERLRNGPLHFVNAVQLLIPIAQALQHAHERGVCHRDVKPANILINQQDVPYLADFGLALRDIDLGTGPIFLGTPGYMSPEQARSQGHLVDGRSDIFSLGAVFFKTLTGRRPFLANSVDEILDLIVYVDAPSVRQKKGDIPAELDRICAKALSRIVDDRYRCAKDFADDLQAWLNSFESTLCVPHPSLNSVEQLPLEQSYERRTILGRGGMGIVYRARQISPDREVALKCLMQGDEKTHLRFLNEIQALGKVEHPHLVRIYASGQDQGRYFYAMELVEGVGLDSLIRELRCTTSPRTQDSWQQFISDLSERQKANEQLVVASGDSTGAAETTLREAIVTHQEGPRKAIAQLNDANYQKQIAELILGVARAVGALHAAGIVHRDIKPQNIRIAHDAQRAVLLDLGIAKLIDGVAEANSDPLTTTREFVGSLRYASPEQLVDAGQVDQRTDVYSLGATLWELLTLQRLHNIDQATSDAQAILRIQLVDPQPIRKFNPSVSKDLEAIVQKCLEKQHRNRYENGDELAADLQNFLDGKTVSARYVCALSRAFRRCRRQPVVTGLVGVLFLMTWAFAITFFPLHQATDDSIRIGIKPWVGFSPLIVADEMKLCEDVELKFVPVYDTTDVRQKVLSKELDAAPYLVDSHALARANRTPTKAVLQLDVSLTADAIVATQDIRRFEDLRGKTIAYMHHEAPHFLLLSLCEKFDLDTSEFQHRKTASPKEAVDLFLSGEADAVVAYDPFLKATRQIAGSHRLASAADEPGTIIDILTIRQEFLQSEPSKVKKLIAGWMQAVELLERGDPTAIRIACKFLGEPDRPLSADEYLRMAAGMRYSGIEENLAFFRLNENGKNEFQERLRMAQDRWDRHHQLKVKTDPAEGDGSQVFLELYGP